MQRCPHSLDAEAHLSSIVPRDDDGLTVYAAPASEAILGQLEPWGDRNGWDGAIAVRVVSLVDHGPRPGPRIHPELWCD